MPRLVIELGRDEFDRLNIRAQHELRHPRATARLMLRRALGLPTMSVRSHENVRERSGDQVIAVFNQPDRGDGK